MKTTFNYIFLFCSLLITPLLHAQNVSIEHSDWIKDFRGYRVKCFDGTYYYWDNISNGESGKITHLDSKFKLIKENKITSYRDNGDKHSISGIIGIKDKLYLLSIVHGKKDIIIGYVQTIDKNTLTLNQDIKEVAQCKYSQHVEYIDPFTTYKSDDTSKILFKYNIDSDKTFKTGNNSLVQGFGFIVFDSQFNKLWENKFAIPSDIANVQAIQDYSIKVYNSGCVSVYGITYKSKAVTLQSDPGKNHFVFLFDESGKSISKFEITVPNKNITDCGVFDIGKPEILVAGYISTEGYSSATGYFLGKLIPGTKEMKLSVQTDFTDEFIQKHNSLYEMKDKNNKGGILLLKTKDVKLNSDHSFYLISEQESHVYLSSGSGYGSVSKSWSQSIFITKVFSKGEVEWMKYIPKKQDSRTSSYTPFFYVNANDKLYFFYDDEIDNLKANSSFDNLDVKTIPGLQKGDDFVNMTATINTKGEIKREYFYTFTKNQLSELPTISLFDKQVLVWEKDRKQGTRFSIMKLNSNK